ncbi:hypothetical protein V7138_23075 [Bacillus sp. JJ1533]|uniref:hypothetical protein n=1 Tax=Bacillus sp. JJ1533 TaxID=3122959 RepID=UPI002FFEEF87
MVAADASITDGETEPQEVTTVNTDENSEKEEVITTVVDEPLVENIKINSIFL